METSKKNQLAADEVISPAHEAGVCDGGSYNYEDGEREHNRVEGGTLYLVATPIGNLADMTYRAVKVLSEVDFVAAEDTRNSGRLLARYGISKPMVSYHEHNKASRGAEIADRLAAGESCALVTDAGTPGISDPGEDLVSLCAGRGIPVVPLPGACAGISALIVSGLPTSRFCFEGFLPASGRERRERLAEVAAERRTVILHEAPHRLRATLSDLREATCGERRISICRELTKLNEQILRLTLDGAVEYYDKCEPRGEYVLVLEGAAKSAETEFWRGLDIAAHVRHYIESGMPERDAVKAAARDRGVPKNAVYNEYVRLKNEEK